MTSDTHILLWVSDDMYIINWSIGYLL
jgi:hypothetical protein